jgi:hypothetical protein
LIVGREAQTGLVCTGYRLQRYNFNACDGETYAPDELYDSIKTVKEDCRWYPVELSDDDWAKLTGKREQPEGYAAPEEDRPWIHRVDSELEVSIEDSEIGVCCAGISAARDLLIACSRHGGMIFRDVRRLVAAFDGSGHGDMLFEDKLAETLPILHAVVAQLPMAAARTDCD